MKNGNLLLGMVTLGASLSAGASPALTQAAPPAPVEMRQDCAYKIRSMAAIADDSIYLPNYQSNVQAAESAIKAVQLTNVQIIKVEEDQASGHMNTTYKATIVDGAALHGKVIVQASRGGCFIKKMYLQSK